MHDMPTHSLGEIAQINPATAITLAAAELCSFVPMEAVSEATASIERFSYRPYHELSKGYTAFAENDVLIAKITPCMENGKVAIAQRLHRGIGFGSTEFHVVRAGEHVIPEWIYYYWRLPKTRALAERKMTGSAGQKRVPASFLRELRIPLPAVTEQQKLVRQLLLPITCVRFGATLSSFAMSFSPPHFSKCSVTHGLHFPRTPKWSLVRWAD